MSEEATLEAEVDTDELDNDELESESEETQTNDEAEEQESAPDEAEEAAKLKEEAEKKEARDSKRVQRRIDRLTRDKYELKAKLEALQAGNTQQPTEEQELSQEEILDKLLAEREAKKAEQARFDKSVTLFEKTLVKADLDPEEFIPLPDGAAEAVLELDAGLDVLVFLQENPEEIERLAGLSIARQAVEIGKIEDKLTKPSEPVKKSSAPPPIKPVGGKKTSEIVYSENMSDADYDKWLEQQYRKSKR